MKFRPYAAAVATLATTAFSLAVVAPADAAATDPVTNLQVTQTQVGQKLVITATWDANPDATRYRAYVAGDAAGADALPLFRDTAQHTVTFSTDDLAADQDYWIAVKPIAPSAGSVLTTAFVADQLDLAGPTGTYTLNRTSGYLLVPDFETCDLDCNEDFSADFTATQTSLSDYTTAPGAITRTIEAGDGSAAQPWPTGNTFKLTVHQAGTFTPKVHLTDEFGNLSTVNLPAITAVADTVAPTVSIKVPASPTKVASWRKISGTATDAGTGIDTALAFVVQKRGTIWYAYDFSSQHWLRGSANLTKTVNQSDAEPAVMTVNASGVWVTPTIKGLLKGSLHVEAAAFDGAFNVGVAPARNPVLR